MLLLSLSKSRNCFPLRSEAWNVIFQMFRMSSFLLFLLKSHDVLQEKSGVGLKAFDSLLTALWRDQLRWLGHFQNSMKLFQYHRKNFQSSISMATEWTWKRCEEGSKIFLATWIKSVIMMILEMPSQFEAWLILHLMAKSSISVLVTWTAWWMVFVMGLLWVYVCDIDVAISFLILVSVTIMAVKGEFDNLMTILSSCWVCFIVFLFAMYIKYELIWEIVNNSMTGRKFRMKRSKRRKNSIKPVVCIY